MLITRIIIHNLIGICNNDSNNRINKALSNYHVAFYVDTIFQKATFENTTSKRCKTKDNKTNKNKFQVKVNGIRSLDFVCLGPCC